MRKILLAGLSFIFIALFYYFTAGTGQLTNEMKTQVDSHIAELQTQGFTVQGKELSENKEQLIITVDNSDKITTYLNTHGLQATLEDIKALKGTKLGIDVTYLADAYSAVSFDIYPIALPTALLDDSFSKEDKKAIETLQRLIDKKTFWVHIDVNKLGNGFKGYMKDINETVEGKEKMTLEMNDFTFEGDIKNEKITKVTQALKHFALQGEKDLFTLSIKNFTSHYAVTGDSKYNYESGYGIKEITLGAAEEFHLRADDLSLISTSKETNGTTSMTAKTTLDTLSFKEGPKVTLLKTVDLHMLAKNFDMKALEALEKVDPENDEEMMKVLQGLISNGMDFDIPNLSVKQVEMDGQLFDGFRLKSHFEIDKSLDLSKLEQNPLSAMNAMDAKIDLTLSNQLFGLLAQHPESMMVMMFIQPQDVNGSKVYKIELKDGNLKLNNKPMR
jgi:hypothetical protein